MARSGRKATRSRRLDDHARGPDRGAGGPPGIYGDSATDIYYDNFAVKVNEHDAQTAVLALAACPIPVRGAAGSRRTDPGRGPSAPCSAAASSRNMVSDEKGLPADWDVKTGKNVKWWADVGSQAYARPGGRRRQGLRRHQQRRPAQPRRQGDNRGVVMAFERGHGRVPLADDAREALRRAASTTGRSRASAPRRSSKASGSTTSNRPRREPRHRGPQERQRRARHGREGQRARPTATWSGSST